MSGSAEAKLCSNIVQSVLLMARACVLRSNIDPDNTILTGTMSHFTSSPHHPATSDTHLISIVETFKCVNKKLIVVFSPSFIICRDCRI